ncbi:MAG: hypothetical protein H6Q25_1388, partial [Bacteroidetes bacterium]|nr:hypothetical protein [Bacteroidota bacterium]
QMAISFSRKGDFDMKVIQLGDLDKEELKKSLYPKIKTSKKIIINDQPVVKRFLQDKKLSYYVCDQKEQKKVKSRNKAFENYMKWFMQKIKYRHFDLCAYHLAIDGLQNKRGKLGYKESVMFIN